LYNFFTVPVLFHDPLNSFGSVVSWLFPRHKPLKYDVVSKQTILFRNRTIVHWNEQKRRSYYLSLKDCCLDYKWCWFECFGDRSQEWGVSHEVNCYNDFDFESVICLLGNAVLILSR